MRTFSLRQELATLCIVGYAFFALPTSLFAQTDTLFEGANEYRSSKIGLRALVPNYWLTYDVTYTSLRGVGVEYLRLYPRADKGSRISTALDVYASSIDGIFNIPTRLRGKLSDADLINWYVDRLARSLNAFKIRSVRKETWLGVPTFVIEYSERTYDKYDMYTTIHFLFDGDKVYAFSEWFLSHRPASKEQLSTIRKEIRFLTSDEIRFAP